MNRTTAVKVVALCASTMLAATACGGEDVDFEESAEDDSELARKNTNSEDLSLPSLLDKNGFPLKEPLRGRKTISCDAVQNESASKCNRMVDYVAGWYTRNSRGNLKLSRVKGRGDYHFKVDTSKRGNNVTVQSQFTKAVAVHEFGHKIGLTHSIQWEKSNRVTDRKRPYLDETTPLNGHGSGSPYLAAPQYYIKDWLPAREVALYQKPDVYVLKKISDFERPGRSVVIVTPRVWNKRNPNYGPSLYLSWPAPAAGWKSPCRNPNTMKCVAIHSMNNLKGLENTSKIATINEGDEFYDDNGSRKARTGIHVKALPSRDENFIRVQVDFATRSSR